MRYIITKFGSPSVNVGTLILLMLTPGVYNLKIPVETVGDTKLSRVDISAGITANNNLTGIGIQMKDPTGTTLISLYPGAEDRLAHTPTITRFRDHINVLLTPAETQPVEVQLTALT